MQANVASRTVATQTAVATQSAEQLAANRADEEDAGELDARGVLLNRLEVPELRSMLQERGLRPDGLKYALVARLLAAGAGGTGAQAAYAQGLMRRRRSIVPPGPEELGSTVGTTRWLTRVTGQ